MWARFLLGGEGHATTTNARDGLWLHNNNRNSVGRVSHGHNEKVKESGSSGRNKEQIEETRMIQELHQKLLRMEERIEALETILLENDERKDDEK
jgi:TolA-binding protein